MRLLTADTIIKVKQPLPLPRRCELTGETRIRLSQIVDLLTWRLTTDQKDRNGKEHSEKNGRFVEQSEGKNNQKTKATKAKRKRRPGSTIKPFTIEKTQTVVKRDAKGNIVDSNWEIKAGATIDHAELIAEGNDIKDVKRLVREHPGTKPEEWTKEKGVGIIEPKKGAKNKRGKQIRKGRKAELHWYRTKKNGPIEIKRTAWAEKPGDKK